MRKQYCLLWNWSHEQNKLYIVQTNIKTVSFSKLFIVLMQWTLSIISKDKLVINSWLFENLKLRFLEQFGCLALNNGQRKVLLLTSMISGVWGSAVLLQVSV